MGGDQHNYPLCIKDSHFAKKYLMHGNNKDGSIILHYIK